MSRLNAALAAVLLLMVGSSAYAQGGRPPVTAVPEPGAWATMGVMAAGLGGLILRARRKK